MRGPPNDGLGEWSCTPPEIKNHLPDLFYAEDGKRKRTRETLMVNQKPRIPQQAGGIFDDQCVSIIRHHASPSASVLYESIDRELP